MSQFFLGILVGFFISSAAYLTAVYNPYVPKEEVAAVPVSVPVVAIKALADRPYVRDCDQDLKRFCSGQLFGKGGGNCLLAVKGLLSDKCAAHLEVLSADVAQSQARAAYVRDCEDDISKVCKGKTFGAGAGGCLLKYRAKLSSRCSQHLEQLERDLREE